MTSEYQNDECKASDTEEPGAVILHAGICAGAVGQLAVLPRLHKFRRAKNAVIPAGIAGLQKPWRANSSHSKCLILVICSPHFHIPVDWIPAIPAGMTGLQHLCITASAPAWECRRRRSCAAYPLERGKPGSHAGAWEPDNTSPYTEARLRLAHPLGIASLHENGRSGNGSIPSTTLRTGVAQQTPECRAQRKKTRPTYGADGGKSPLTPLLQRGEPGKYRECKACLAMVYQWLGTSQGKPCTPSVPNPTALSSPRGRGSLAVVMMAALLALVFAFAPPIAQAAQLTLKDGVVVKFGANAQLEVRDQFIPGKRIAFTSLKDDNTGGQTGTTPQIPNPGDWLGVSLEQSASAYGPLSLNNMTFRYGGGQNEAALSVNGWNPALQFVQITDSLLGLRTSGGASPVITGASFLRNLTGIEADDTSAPSISGSQFAGNSLLAINNQTSTVIQAPGNWWGSATGPKDSIANPTGLGDAVTPLGVNFKSFLTLAPLINPSVWLASSAPYFDQHSVLLDVACLNAVAYRVVEGNNFGSLPFQPLSNNQAQLLFTTSDGDGFKTINAQFRDASGTLTNATLTGGVLIDTQDPTLALDNPATGSLIRQAITLDAQVYDQVGLAQVQFFLGSQLLASFTAAPYSYYWDTSALADGDYTITAVATDIAGRSSQQSATVTYSHYVPPPDTEGPVLSNIDANGVALVNGASFSGNAAISFTAGDRSGVAGISLLLDGNALVSANGGGSGLYTASLNLAGVTNGSHTLTLQATDSLGNVSATGFTFTVAHLPPPTPVLSQPASGLVTRSTSLTVSGTAELNSTVQLLNNGQPVGSAITADGDGAFLSVVSLTSGNNSIQATATDQYGTGPVSNAVTVTLDLSIPTGPSNLSATAQPAGKVHLVWTGTNDPNASGYAVYRSASAFTDISQATQINPSPSAATAYDDLPPNDGLWYYRVVAVNAAGTSSVPSNSAQAISDSITPSALSILYTPSGKVDPATGGIGQGNVSVVLTVNETLVGLPYLSIVPQGGSPIALTLTQTSNTTYTSSFPVDANTPSGVANALFSARDAVGNRGTGIDQGATLKLETVGPALSGITLDPASPINTTTTQTVTATLNFSEPPATAPTVQALLSGPGRSPQMLNGLVSVDPTTWTSSFTLPSDAGLAAPETLTFSFQAQDVVGNVSTQVLASNRFQVYQGQLPPLDVPQGFTAQAIPGGKVNLAWAPVDGAASYQVYRQAQGQASLLPLTNPAGNHYTDLTPQDGSFAYAVASVRHANGQQAVSGPSPSVTVAASATAPGAPQNLTLQLTGQGIVALWQAPSSGKVASYNLYRAGGSSITSITGLSPNQTGILAPQAVDANPSPTQSAYVVTALDAVGNESVISNSAYLNASLLPVTNFEIDQIGTASPVLSWNAPNSTVAGYQVFADVIPGAALTPLTASPITALNFTDTSYTGGGRNYTVSSVDAFGAEMPNSLLLPSVQASVVGGLPIQRGVMNSLQVQVANQSASPLTNVSVVIHLPIDQAATQFQDFTSASFNLDANQTRQATVVVGGYATLPSTVQAQVSVVIAPNAGERVKIANTQALNVVDSSLTVGMSTASFTRGGTGSLKLNIENTSDVEIELLTATNNGQNDSTELRFKLLDADGNVLATLPFRQTQGADIVSLNNGMTVARIPGHSSVVSDPFTLNIPGSSPDSLRVRLEIDKLHYHTGQPDEIDITGRNAETVVSLQNLPYYGTVASVSPAMSFGDQNVVITGSALDSTTQNPLPNTLLSLVLNQQGYERVFTVLTGSDGTFTYTFTPTLTDVGLYKLSAINPASTDRPEQQSFTIYRVGVGPSPYALNVPKNFPFTVPFIAQSGPGTAATNLRLVLNASSQLTGQLPTGIIAQLPAPVTLTAQQTNNLPVVFTADNSAQSNGSLILDFISDEHPTPLGQVLINYSLSPANPNLVSSPSFVETGLAQGSSQIESVTISNNGLQDALNLQFTLTNADGSPAPAWASIASQANGTLALGATRSINLSFTPPTGTPDGVYQFKLNVLGDNVTAQSLKVYASVTESGQGSVQFDASDIYTDTVGSDGTLIPGLAGATITVQNEDVATVTRSLTTDSQGVALFQNLPAGFYQFTAQATNHQDKGGRFQIKPGVTYDQAVFLDYTLITVDWSVTPVTITDTYQVVLNATFQTDVPAPVVVLQPTGVNLPAMAVGQVFYGQLTLTNFGLVRADHVSQQLPQTDAYFRYEFLANPPTSLEANQSVTLPYRVTALQSLDAAAGSATASGGGCYNYSNGTSVNYDYTCANGVTTSGSTGTAWISVSNSSCSVSSGGTSGGGGSSSGGGVSSGGGYLGWGGFGFGSGSGTGTGTGNSGGIGGGGMVTPLITNGSKCVFVPRGNGSQCN